jgi:23S rRNA pseudouridine1911/1915/1917 synthase
MLAQGRVSVNGVPRNIAAHPVLKGDTLEIGPRRIPIKLPDNLQIIYEDTAIVVIHKPPGLLTVSTAAERERTAYAYLSRYLKERNPRRKLFTVHRLDKLASGVLVFAKSEQTKSALKDLFSRHDIDRKYWAIVEGKVEKARGTIRSYLTEDVKLRMHSTDDIKRGKLAVTHFRVLRNFQNLTALEVTLETGRRNQIRVHLSEQGHPIVGDRAHGSAQNPLGRLGLHAFQLGFRHPTNGTPLLFRTEPPPEFIRYLPKA